MIENLIVWIVLGLIAGVIANLIVGGGFGLLGSIVLGIVGAVVGGFLARALGLGTVRGINPESIVIATVGAVLVIAVARAASGRRRAL